VSDWRRVRSEAVTCTIQFPFYVMPPRAYRSEPPVVSGVECGSFYDHALISANSYPDLLQGEEPSRLPPLQLRASSSNKSFRTLGLTEPCAPQPTSPDRRTTVEDDDDPALTTDAPAPCSPARVPTGESLVTVSATTTAAPNNVTRNPVDGAVYPTLVARAPGEPYIVDLRPGKRCFKCLFTTSIVVIAGCAVFASAFVYYRVDQLEQRIRVLEAAASQI
jgi:hypothetical protein